MTSIRRRVLSMAMGVFVLGWFAVALLSYRSARHEVEELLDAELAQSAHVVLGLTLHEIDEEGAAGARRQLPVVIERALTGQKYEDKLSFQIWIGDTPLLKSPNAPPSPLASGPGFRDARLGEATWRVFSLVDAQRQVRIDVAQHMDVRDELVRDIVRDMSWPLLLTLPILALGVGAAIARGLRPLAVTAREIARRSPQQLAPLARDHTPLELRPLVEELNRLLARLRAALEGERRFTANASHELRTPLAGLKAQAQVALRAKDFGQHQQALDQIVHGVDRATHLLEQLLALARLDPDHAAANYAPVALTALAREVLAELAPAAHAKRIALDVHTQGHDVVRANRTALAVLLRNLIDNAIRYTPADGAVAARIDGDARHVRLTIRDNGPGIPAAQRAAALERFQRLAGDGEPGCGLGLSIVKRIAELHDARLELADPPTGGGLDVRVEFPALG